MISRNSQWVNIDGSDDPGYRYKMPTADVQFRTFGKSGHTLVANAADIAKCLQRPPQYLAKYMGLGVGALSAYDPPQGAIDLRGNYPKDALQTIIKLFVRHWVLCARCGLPETSIIVTPGSKKHACVFDCKACGARTAADPEHKMTSFIVSNPPNLKGTGLASGSSDGARTGGKASAAVRAKEDARRERARKREAAAEQRKADRKAAKAEERERRRREDLMSQLGSESSSDEEEEEAASDEEIEEEEEEEFVMGEGGEYIPTFKCQRCGLTTHEPMTWSLHEALRFEIGHGSCEHSAFGPAFKQRLEFEKFIGGIVDKSGGGGGVDVTDGSEVAVAVKGRLWLRRFHTIDRGGLLLLTPRSLNAFPKQLRAASPSPLRPKLQLFAEGGFKRDGDGEGISYE